MLATWFITVHFVIYHLLETNFLHALRLCSLHVHVALLHNTR